MNASLASAAVKALRVDPLLSPGRSERDMTAEDGVVKITLVADDARTLRSLSNAHFDSLSLIVATMQEHAPHEKLAPASQAP